MFVFDASTTVQEFTETINRVKQICQIFSFSLKALKASEVLKQICKTLDLGKHRRKYWGELCFRPLAFCPSS